MIGLTLEERETHCWRDDVPGGEWQIETSSPRMWARLDKMFKATEVNKDGGKTYAKVYKVPLGCISVHRLRKVSEATKERLRALGDKPAGVAAQKAILCSGDGSTAR